MGAKREGLINQQAKLHNGHAGPTNGLDAESCSSQTPILKHKLASVNSPIRIPSIASPLNTCTHPHPANYPLMQRFVLVGTTFLFVLHSKVRLAKGAANAELCPK